MEYFKFTKINLRKNLIEIEKIYNRWFKTIENIIEVFQGEKKNESNIKIY